MGKIKAFFSLIPALILWLMLSALVWGFVFTRITDTDPAHKLTLFIDTQVADATALAVRLEEHVGGNIRMVKVHPFTYAMLDGEQLKAADLFIIRADRMETYGDWLAPLPEEMRGEGPEYLRGGDAWGILAFDAESKTGLAADCVAYLVPGEPAWDYYLCFGNQSLHFPTQPNAVDSAAVDAAKLLLTMR
ncbi:MAG: hypothetical protein IK099_11155 [Clostridia bacterium]|nr:hypothetical protein [Clostridia bacterium]